MFINIAVILNGFIRNLLDYCEMLKCKIQQLHMRKQIYHHQFVINLYLYTKTLICISSYVIASIYTACVLGLLVCSQYKRANRVVFGLRSLLIKITIIWWQASTVIEDIN